MFKKFFEEWIVKIGVTRTSSPNLKAEAKDNSTVNQTNIQNQLNFAGVDQIFNNKVTYTWLEKKDAVENLTKSIIAFFFAVIGRNRVGGFMTAQNLDANGRIKDHCLKNAKYEFAIAKTKLKTAVSENTRKLEEDDQKKVIRLQDFILQKDMYEITIALEKEILSEAESIFKKYKE